MEDQLEKSLDVAETLRNERFRLRLKVLFYLILALSCVTALVLYDVVFDKRSLWLSMTVFLITFAGFSWAAGGVLYYSEHAWNKSTQIKFIKDSSENQKLLENMIVKQESYVLFLRSFMFERLLFWETAYDVGAQMDLPVPNYWRLDLERKILRPISALLPVFSFLNINEATDLIPAHRILHSDETWEKKYLLYARAARALIFVVYATTESLSRELGLALKSGWASKTFIIVKQGLDLPEELKILYKKAAWSMEFQTEKDAIELPGNFLSFIKGNIDSTHNNPSII